MCFTILFFIHHTATTEFYTLSLHDALPIFSGRIPATRSATQCLFRFRRARVRTGENWLSAADDRGADAGALDDQRRDRKSTRLNSSHMSISYAVFCLKKKKKKTRHNPSNI